MSTFNYKADSTPSSDYNGENTILIVNWINPSGDVAIPANAFQGLISPSGPNPPVGSVSLIFENASQPISNTVLINNNAFDNCPSLTSVTFPPSLTIIAREAFIIPDGTTLGASEGLSTVTFTDIANSKLDSIGEKAFQNQSNLINITLPKSLKVIRTSAFENTGLTTLIFDDIANSQLEEIKSDISSSLNNSSAFQGTNLTSVILPANLKLIGNNAFSISSLTSVTFFDTALSRLDIIYAEAFSGANIGTIRIPNHITQIGTNAFLGSDGMTVKMNSKVVNTLGITYSDTTFYGATGVTIEADENTYEYTPGTSIPTAAPPSGYGGEPTILVNNSTVTNIIPASAFEGLITVASAASAAALVFANDSTIQSIGADAFKNCTGLKHATIPDSIKTIGTNAFIGSGLQIVYISRKTAATLGIPVPSQNVPFYGATGVTIVEYPITPPPPPDIIFPYPKNEKNKRLLGVNQKISSGLARPNFKFQTNQFSAGRSRTAQSKQKADGPYTVIFPIR